MAFTRETNTGLSTITDIVGNVFEAHTAVLFLRRGPKAYGVASAFSLSDHVAREAVLAPGEGLVGWILRNRKPLLITNFDKKRGILGYYRSGGESSVRAFMGSPLGDGAEGESLGVLCLDSRRTYSFSERDQKILHQFAQLAHGLAMESQARKREDTSLNYYRCLCTLSALRDKFARWDVYLEHFLSLVSQATGFEHCCLAVRGEDGASYHLEGISGQSPGMWNSMQGTFPLGSGLVGWVFKHNQPVVRGADGAAAPASSGNGDAGGQPLFGSGADCLSAASALCLPLPVHKRVRAVLCLASGQPMPVDEDLRTFAAMVAGNLAQFLENLYLKNRLTP